MVLAVLITKRRKFHGVGAATEKAHSAHFYTWNKKLVGASGTKLPRTDRRQLDITKE